MKWSEPSSQSISGALVVPVRLLAIAVAIGLAWWLGEHFVWQMFCNPW